MVSNSMDPMSIEAFLYVSSLAGSRAVPSRPYSFVSLRPHGGKAVDSLADPLVESSSLSVKGSLPKSMTVNVGEVDLLVEMETEKAVSETEELPKTIVRRVVKDKLHDCSPDTDIAVHKDALVAFSESARIFIHYVSATANDICKESKRQTINGDDVLKAIEEIDFPELIGPLRASLDVPTIAGLVFDDVQALCKEAGISKCHAISPKGNGLAHNLAPLAVSSQREQPWQGN
ncbi:hypothetical protein EZV62_002182 [Acer yangbiense]|uniref:Transcription factor CBF/NF-Y/archaeal histone domain-containing protein n=1 Tax=Acer yangbiense TaxID=1000413 RepID=A0A5C7IWI5_9ROSI|nr:hypothetical protein EZV62_002182 [Acer yangbiense]